MSRHDMVKVRSRNGWQLKRDNTGLFYAYNLALRGRGWQATFKRYEDAVEFFDSHNSHAGEEGAAE